MKLKVNSKETEAKDGPLPNSPHNWHSPKEALPSP